MNELGKRIAAEIRKSGAITFARFMELALYCPIYGYYEKEGDRIGRKGDYYTSVSVGSLFGELLAFQFAEWLEEARAGYAAVAGASPRPAIRLVEAGAHDGTLAKDILSWLGKHRPAVSRGMEYWIVEPSERRRQAQRETLRDFGGAVHWAKAFNELIRNETADAHRNPGEGVVGVVFSNELLDAMPVRRFGWDAQTRSWFEWGVAVEGVRFAWTRLLDRGFAGRALQSWIPRRSQGRVAELWACLPDSFTIEYCPAAEQWWRAAAAALRQGRLLTIDYGLSADELFVPERTAGTLRAIRSHHLDPDVLAEPGERDITADVNFTAIQTLGESAGLTTDLLSSQARFLTGIAARAWGAEKSPGERTTSRTREFQTLTHPEHLGSAFRVLVQSRSRK